MIRRVPHDILDDGRIVIRFDAIENLPMISVVTCTKDRSLFYDLMLRNWNTMDYPLSRREWVIVEDGSSDMRKFLSEKKAEGTIKYVKLLTPVPIGEKRNKCVENSSSGLIVHMDDDDYYPPESVLARVRVLLKHSLEGIECVGCLRVRCYNLLTEDTFEAFDPVTNMSESTLAYTRNFWSSRSFDPSSYKTEGYDFIKDRYDSCLDIPSQYVICQFTHHKNTITRCLTDTVMYGDNFTSTVPSYVKIFVDNLRLKVAMDDPFVREAVMFVRNVNKNMRDDKMISKLNALDTRVQRTPVIQEFRSMFDTKKKRHNSKELVYFCGPGRYLYHTNIWDYDNNNFGGSEEAVLNICRYFSEKYAFDVTVYNVRDDVKRYRFGKGSVTFVPYYRFNRNDFHTTVVLWRDVSHADVCFPNTRKLVLDLHDVIDPSWMTSDRYSRLDFVLVKSEYHKSLLNSAHHPKCVVIPNGILEHEFPCTSDTLRKPLSFLSTSAADRCLTSLLRLYPKIIETNPSCSMMWAYGFDGLSNNPSPNVQEWISDRRREITKSVRFINAGKVPIDKVSELYRTHDVFLYPAQFPEIDCVSLTKALASGCFPIYTDVGALKEKSKFGGICIPHPSCRQFHDVENVPSRRLDYTLDEEVYASFERVVVDWISSYDRDELSKLRVEMRDRVLKTYGMQTVVSEWKSLLYG